ncbi:MAG: AAA family ATPase [Clostridia bacterium]|nr:AAA family ATPase [Clostridia bacterium]
MSINIAVGDESFDEIRQSGLYYVDKTELIYDLVGKTKNKVTLFTRPRRFGKTLNMSMMESFFDINRDSKAVFDGLDIMKHDEFCAEWMNQYPVLFISLKDVDGLDFEKAYGKLRVILADLCKKHTLLIGNDAVDPADKVIFEKLRFNEAGDEDIQNSLKTIMRMMNAVYGKPVILLVDEYDVPLAKASEKNTEQNRYYEQMLDVIKGMLSIALKTNEYLKFAVVTGCLRIAKESIFTGTNNFASYSVLEDRFGKYFGFTQAEVNTLLADTELSDKADIFKSWYDGYVFGNTPVYCPWDVVSYISALLYDRSAKPKNYWRNTSGNGVIRQFVGKFQVSRKFETLMNGGTITEVISDELTYDQIEETEQNLWNILLMTGYLTKADSAATGDAVALKIPNKEIAGIFQDSVAIHFREKLEIPKQEKLMEALWAGDTDTASKLMSELLRKTISYMDYHEDYYHAFLAGIFVGRGYETESNKEKGLGRPDLQLFDQDHDRAMVIEAKKADSKKLMGKECDDALKQIVDNEYAVNLQDEFNEVFCYGIAFFQKSAMIKKL